ncbi:MAG: hypothetical protein IPO35_13345 [Uliginosibacterium sp.]|nr:hypothetical protein [Uliginosibacterium sp.]MBK9616435.1 hypothetical protein [Uliginosibacterium sp.]
MSTRTAIAVCALLVPILCSAEPRDKECQDWTNQAMENPSVGCEAACSQAKRFDKYDYHSGLVGALGSRQGFGNFIRYSGRSTIMGAGADEQACHLYTLLLKWGDESFAQTVASGGRKTRERVIGLLDYAAVTNFKKRFPKTYGLVSQHEEL